MFKIVMLGPALTVRGGVTTVEQVYLDNWNYKGYEITHIATMIDGSKWQKIWVAVIAFIKFVYMALLKRPKIIHIHFASRASFYRKSVFIILAKILQLKVVAHAHGAEFHLFYQHECNIIQKKYIKWVLNLADNLIAVSVQWQEYYKSIYNKNTPIVVYNSVYCPLEHPQRNIKYPKILMLGKLSQRKGTYDLVKVIPKVLQKHPNAEFWLGGDGDVENIQSLIDLESWSDHVKLLGWVKGNEKNNFLSQANLFVLPSYNEGLPMAILEALAYGLPVISTPVGGIPEAIIDGENGFLVKPGDVNDIANKIIYALNDAMLYEKLSENARQCALEKFNINKAIEQIMNLYLKTIK